MEVFSYINEIAVLGSALFFVAGGYVWFSFFTHRDTQVASESSNVGTAALVQLVSYISVMSVVAFMITAAPLLGVSKVSVVLLIWVVLLAAYSFSLWQTGPEYRPRLEFVVWLTTVVGVGALLINYWPW